MMLPIKITPTDVGRTCITRDWNLVKITGFKDFPSNFPVKVGNDRYNTGGIPGAVSNGEQLMCFAPAIEGDVLKIPVENADRVCLGILLGALIHNESAKLRSECVKELLNLLDVG